MSEPTAVHSLVRKIEDGEAAKPLRLAAARGALPLPRAMLIRLQILLREDGDDEVRREAEGSLSTLGEAEIGEVLSDPECPPEVMNHLAAAAAREASLAEKLVFHPAVPAPALAEMAEKGGASIIELILTNQEKLLASPGLLDRLSANPALRPDQRGRILDMLSRFFDQKRQDEHEGGEAGEDYDDEPLTAEEAARLLDVDVGELFAASEILGGEEFERAEDPVVRSAYRRILTMNTAQKAMLAMKGGREERMILIRDSNKMVSLSVLKNHRVTEQEVESIAMMRNVDQEVLRALGTNREWTKNYSVAAALVRNPRTPPGVSTNFISRLQNRDLKLLSRDKNVPEIVRKMSKRTLELRTQKQASRFRRK